MPDIALLPSTASNKTNNSTVAMSVEESNQQVTLPLAADTPAGAPVFVNSNGRLQMTDADTTAAGTQVYITVKNGKAGQPRTAISDGIVEGYNFSALSFGASVYLSNNVGKIADGAGTISRKVGEVFPIYGQVRGGSPRKALRIKL